MTEVCGPVLGLKRDERPWARTPVLETIVSSSSGGNVFSQHPFDLGDLLLGFLYPLADRGAEHDAELAFVRDRQELRADHREQHEGADEEQHDGGDEQAAVSEHPAQRVLVAPVQGFVPCPGSSP